MARPVTPGLTVDALLLLEDGRLVLIERKYEPHGYALPGGFVDVGETVEAACVREVKEETGLEVEALEQFHVYSDPARDVRHHNVSVVFLARARGEPRASDDAAGVRIVSPEALPTPLCFDHAKILNDYRHFVATGQRPGQGWFR